MPKAAYGFKSLLPHHIDADIAQLVEHHLAKVRVASSSLVVRSILIMYAPLAQLDRVTGFEPGGRGFKSYRAHQRRKSQIYNNGSTCAISSVGRAADS